VELFCFFGFAKGKASLDVDVVALRLSPLLAEAVVGAVSTGSLFFAFFFFLLDSVAATVTGTTAFTSSFGSGSPPSLLSELTTDPASKFVDEDASSWENLHESPLRQPAADMKKAHGGGLADPSSAVDHALSLYFFAMVQNDV
jgi:hypothetical protein